MAPHSTSPTLPASFTALPEISLSNGANGTNRADGTDGANDANGLNRSQDAQTDFRPGAPSIPIAIVGMACRFSGDVTSPSKLWDLCAAGKDGWSAIPESRFDVNSLYHANQAKAGRSNVIGGYFLDQDIARFDAAFFNLPSDAASGLDPQARLLLEAVYEATEDGGIPLEKLAGSNTSVYTGTFTKDYHEMQTKDVEVLSRSFLAGTGTALLSNRISHFYDLQGPSMSIDTGCSSGIVAVHQACQSIRTEESEISIVGAASTLLSQDTFISASTIGAIGSEGRCYAWDDRAAGYGRGEGVAALILKPLSAALRDGDQVHAVIKDTGLNQDGKTTTITSPSTDAQVKLIQDCYRRAGLDISETGYVEAHMTGTPAGDPVEAEAIARTFGKTRQAYNPIQVGSVKTNLGHTEAVSGLAAIIKTAYVLKHAMIPPNLNYKNGNPSIPLHQWHLEVPTTLTPWPQDKPLRASINNFGYGGTNGHAILEPAPSKANLHRSNGEHTAVGSKSWDHQERVFVVSAKDLGVCQSMMRRLAGHILETLPSAADLAYTLSERRSRHPWVTAVRAKSIKELAERLQDPECKPLHAYKRPRLGFVFNGQGAQWYAMGRELITTYPVFCRAIIAAGAILKEFGASWSLIDELMRDKTSTRVSEVRLSQPISAAIQLALVDLLKSWGITPSAVTSHSSGEVAAAYAVELLSFREALGVAYYRGNLAKGQLKAVSGRSGMLAAGLGQESAERYIDAAVPGRVVVACINSPNSVTLSGDLEAMDELVSILDKDGVFVRNLKVPMGYHSHHMMPMAAEYTDMLQQLLPASPQNSWNGCLFTSPVTGEVVTSAKALGPEHWVHNMTSPVQFSSAFEKMCFSSTETSAQTANVDLIIEIGAHSTLAGPIRQILKARDTTLPYVSCLKRSVNAVETMQDLACDLLCHGYPVCLTSVNSPIGGTPQEFVTDLPTYPWNHATRFWVESRASKEQRFKKFPPHELLGTPLNGSNALTPTWRNFLRLSEIEWLRDHQIDSTVVFPGAGYISMAIEAMRLIVDPSEEKIQGYRLRDIDIMNALIIPDTESGVETQLCLRCCSERELDYEGWYQFEVCSLAGGGNAWIENCKGYVSVETGEAKNTRTPPQEETFFAPGAETSPIDSEVIFSSLRNRGIYHGPIFQNLIDSRAAGDKAVTNFAVSDIACQEHDYVLHPTTLDSILQASYSSLPDSVRGNAMVLPTSIRSLHIPKALKRQGGEKLRAFTELVKADKQGYTSNITIVSEDASSENTSSLELQGFFGQAVPRRVEDADGEPAICSKSCWELDILHKPPLSLRDSLVIPLTEKEIEEGKRLSEVSYYFIHEAVAELQGQESESWEWHHKRFYSWMKEVVAQGEAGEFVPNSGAWSQASQGVKRILADELSAGNAAGQLTVRVGRQLANIVRGEIMPLELMMEGDLLNQFYMQHEALKTRSYSHLAKVVELYAVKNPGAKVLEIGAGTGGATTTILESFGARGDGTGTLLDHYTFTDISPGFFKAAREKFAPWLGMMDFKKLDIEVDPLSQSFSAGTFDLIVAASCLHATKSLNRTMKHVRKLLKPGGTLLLIEATSDRLEGQLIFGTLPGWWLGEEPERQNSPNAPLSMWDRVLRETGFTGVDFEISDYEEVEFQAARVMLSRTVAKVQESISIIVEDETATLSPHPWLSELVDAIQAKTGVLPTLVALDNVDAFKSTVCIMTAEMDNPFVDGMDETKFERLKELFSHCSGLLWLSCGGLIDSQNPSFSATEGLLRTMRQEDSSKRWVRLDFEHDKSPWTSNKIEHIVHVIEQSFDSDAETIDIEWEYAVKNSMLHVARIYPDKFQDAAARSLNLLPDPELQPFHQPGRPLIWETPISESTSLDPYFVENEVITTTEVPAGMVEIEAKAFGLSFREVMVALGQLEEPLTLHECSGVITGLGPDTEQSGLKIGDRVAALCKGRLASKGRTYWTSVVKLPEDTDMSWENAASFPAAYTTAYGSLIQIAGLQKGESVLIHDAAGETGQAAVVIAQHVGAEVFATCSNKTKRDLLVQHYGIQPDHIFSSSGASFATEVVAMTEGKGVDVILNSLSGPLLKLTWDCMARFGRFVDMTKVDIEANRWLQTAPFTRCATYSSFDLLQLIEYRGSLTQKALVESLRICQERGGTPVYPIMPYSLSDMAAAMQQMQGDAHMGKIVLVPRDGDTVKVVTRPAVVSLDNPDATYLIAGGLGGIGRAIAQWMISKGAKNMVLVSRHATTHPEAPSLHEKAQLAGCQLEIHDCDISDEASLLQLISDCSQRLPPFSGAINGAMVLDDTVFERMTFDQWSNAVRPKINSSRNLHNHLPNLAFYIMLSSVAGVAGHMSQANYAAGNSFEDALARHRTSLGQPAVTIDLFAVKSVGYVADREASGDDRLRARVENVGFGSVDLEAILRIVESAIREPLRKSQSESQVIVGPSFQTLATESAMRHDRRFGTLRIAAQRGLKTVATSNNKTSTAALTKALSKATTMTEATTLVVQAISAKLAEVFNLPLSDVDVELPLSRYGVDSLVAVELCNWLRTGAKARVSVFDILQSASLNEFGTLVASKSEELQSKNLSA